MRNALSFGFEQTFTIPEWWTDPGFVSTSNTPLKLEKMRALAECLVQVSGGRLLESKDLYGHLQYETFDQNEQASFVVTMDPGSIEVKTPPMFFAQIRTMMEPLFVAAERAGLVPYRNWWYGVKTGTEGGCHINMAGLAPETNPLRLNPSLVLKYAAFYHNHPCLHYPFMGVDVGPGGNCMRMDEHELDPHSKHAPGTADSMERYARLAARLNRGESVTAEEVEDHFRGSKLAEDKHSAPSFYKYKAPLFFLEERAVEALREAEDFVLLTDLRLRILERLQQETQIEPLRDFGPALHRERLCSAALWQEFVEMSGELGLDPLPYRRFVERQFPPLKMGVGAPQQFQLREGRRPRVITDIKMRGDLIISKTVDPTFARLEVLWEGDAECVINGKRFASGDYQDGERKLHCVVFDYRKFQGLFIDIALMSRIDGAVIERARFSPTDMMFQQPDFEISSRAVAAFGRHYFNLEKEPSLQPASTSAP